jgi:hypothetical protein
MAAQPGRCLLCDDGVRGHFAPLPDGVLVIDGIQDYAAGYEGRLSAVTWRLYRDGVPGGGGVWRPN